MTTALELRKRGVFVPTATNDAHPLPKSQAESLFQPLDATLTAFAGATITNDVLVYGSGNDQFATTTITAFARSLLDDADASTVRDTIGLGINDSPTFNSLTVTKDIVFGGDSLRAVSEMVSIGSNWQHLNSDYSANVAQAGGLVFNYLPTATQTTTDGAGVFTAGVDGTSNPTVTVESSSGFAQGDIIEIKGSANNDGRYEVHAASSNTLTIRSTANGVTDQVEAFTLGQFTAETDTGATITKITVAVLRTNTSGVFQVAAGAATGLTYRTLVHSATDVASQPITVSVSNYTATAATLAGQFEGINAALGNLGTPYKVSKNATSDWGSASSGVYSIAISAATHGKGTTPEVSVKKVISGVAYPATAETSISINADGDVTISAPDGTGDLDDGRVALQIRIEA